MKTKPKVCIQTLRLVTETVTNATKLATVKLTTMAINFCLNKIQGWLACNLLIKIIKALFIYEYFTCYVTNAVICIHNYHY